MNIAFLSRYFEQPEVDDASLVRRLLAVRADTGTALLEHECEYRPPLNIAADAGSYLWSEFYWRLEPIPMDTQVTTENSRARTSTIGCRPPLEEACRKGYV